MDQKEAEFEYEWLIRQDYEFKLLALLAVLADSHLAYRGTLSDMCDFLGVSTGNSRINKKIKEAIDTLEKDGLLKKIVDGRTFTLTLSKKAEKQRRVIRIQKEWVAVAMHYADMPNKSESVSWMNLLKVWLFLLDRDTQKTKEPISNKKIAEALSFLIGKAGRMMVVFRMSQVDFLIGHVVITAADYRFRLIQAADVFRIFPVPDLAVSQANQAVSCIGRVYKIEIKVLKFKRDQPAFQVHGLRRSDCRIIHFHTKAFFV